MAAVLAALSCASWVSQSIEYDVVFHLPVGQDSSVIALYYPCVMAHLERWRAVKVGEDHLDAHRIFTFTLVR